MSVKNFVESNILINAHDLDSGTAVAGLRTSEVSGKIVRDIQAHKCFAMACMPCRVSDLLRSRNPLDTFSAH